jgi:hypothetical protein
MMSVKTKPAALPVMSLKINSAASQDWFEDMEQRMLDGSMTMPVKCFWCKRWKARCMLGHDPFKRCHDHVDVQEKTNELKKGD